MEEQQAIALVRATILFGLGRIPQIGGLLAGLTGVLWPAEKEDVWPQIRQRTEALVGQKISAQVYQNVENSLAGLEADLDDYLEAVELGNRTTLSQTFTACDLLFDHDRPLFQAKGYELLLLPLFAQFANLHLALLRDGALHGGDWGLDASAIRNKLTRKIKDYGDYADSVYGIGYQDYLQEAGKQKSGEQQFRVLNAFQRDIQIGVLNYRWAWPYFDVAAYPGPVAVPDFREIYSDPVGKTTDSGRIPALYTPTGRLLRIDIWAWDRIDAAQLTYSDHGGPHEMTVTTRMGNSSGGSNQPPHGGSFSVDADPVVAVTAYGGDVFHALQLAFRSASKSHLMGVVNGTRQEIAYPGLKLSSIWINGVSRYYGSADCAVFGFLADEEAIVRAGLRASYKTSPSGESVDALVTSQKGLAVDGARIRAASESEDWEAERRSWRGEVEARRQSRRRERSSQTALPPNPAV
jgi:hypothetical protein